MFKIGEVLSEARRRHGISLRRAEEETKIRAKYLQALEEENFTVIPGHAYVKGFLRTYGDYLDIDGQMLVDEFRSRYEDGFSPNIVPPASTVLLESNKKPNWVPVGIAAVILILMVSYLWGSSGWQKPSIVKKYDLKSSNLSKKPKSAPKVIVPPKKPATSSTSSSSSTASYEGLNLVVTNKGADRCWLRIKTDGDLRFEDVISNGESMSYKAEDEISIRTAIPDALKVLINGKSMQLDTDNPPTTTIFHKEDVETSSYSSDEGRGTGDENSQGTR